MPVARARAGRVPLIGRAAELAVIQTAIAAAVRGEPRAVLLAGEAGIGKTRLLAEAMRMVAADGIALLGRCLDERGMPPYLPWIDAFGRADGESASDAADPERLVSITPPWQEVRHLLFAVDGDDDAGYGSTSRSPELQKLRLFDAVTDALGRLARATPTLLAFDDLHWSDVASNELLRYVLVHLPPVPLVIVGTYRGEEVASNVELTRTIEELHRCRLLTNVPIGPLAANDTAHLVCALLGHDDPPLAAAVHRHSEGNPFFAEEVVRALEEDGGRITPGAPADGERVVDREPPLALPIPASVTAVIERRLARLDAACRDVVEVAALAGRQISVDLVARAAGIAPERVAVSLAEAGRAALIRALDSVDAAGDALGAGADFAFLHDRIRETIDRRIDPVRRRAIHASLGAALETAAFAGDDLARLAALTHHWRLARQTDRAATAAERLGDAAMRAHAHAEAADAYRTALDLRPTGSAVPSQATATPSLLLRFGDAALAAGREDAINAYAAAERASAAANDPVGAARARHRLGLAFARREEFDAAVSSLEAAAAALAADEPDAAHPDAARLADVLVDLGTVLAICLARYDDAIAAGRRGLALAREIPGSAPGLEAKARLAVGSTLVRAGNLADGHALLAPALALALRGGDPEIASEVAGALANYHYWTGDLAASERAAQRRQELATEAGDPYALRHARPWLAIIAISRGDWITAERLLAESERDVARVASSEPRAFLRQLWGVMRLAQGRCGEAVACFEEAIAGFRVSGAATLPWYLGCLAQAYLAVGDLDAATRTATETVAVIATLPPGSLPRGPALAALGIVAVRRHDPNAARRCYDALSPHTGQHHWVLIDRVRGMLAGVLNLPTAAEDHFAAATTAASRGGLRPELALTLTEHGALRRRSSSPEQRAAGEAQLRQALALLGELEMDVEATRVAALLAPAPAVVPRGYPAGLTEREVAVLALVVQGRTNREIGVELGITEKTVTNHLTHVFTKANLDNRAAAVAFAFRHGLA